MEQIGLLSEQETSLNQFKDLEQVNLNLLILRDEAEKKIKEMESANRDLQKRMNEMLEINQKIGKENDLLEAEVQWGSKYRTCENKILNNITQTSLLLIRQSSVKKTSIITPVKLLESMGLHLWKSRKKVVTENGFFILHII